LHNHNQNNGLLIIFVFYLPRGDHTLRYFCLFHLDKVYYYKLLLDQLNYINLINIYHIDPAIPLVIIDSAPIFKMFIESQVPYEYISSLDLLKALKDFDSGQEFIWIEFYDDGVTVYIGHLDEGLKPKFDFMVANKSFKNKEVEGTKEKHPPLPPGTQKITWEKAQELLDGIPPGTLSVQDDSIGRIVFLLQEVFLPQ